MVWELDKIQFTGHRFITCKKNIPRGIYIPTGIKDSNWNKYVYKMNKII